MPEITDRDYVISMGLSLSPGEEIAVGHCKQPPSRAHDKLYIKRDKDGRTILAYCHHCGFKYRGDHPGSTDTTPTKDDYKTLTGTLGLGISDAASCIEAPRNTPEGFLDYYSLLTPNYNLWPEKPATWIKKYEGMSTDITCKYNILGTQYKDIVILQAFVGEEPVIVQKRNFDIISESKYYTVKSNSYEAHFPLGYDKDKNQDTCIIVEDLISAALLQEDLTSLEYNGIVLPLFGTNLSDFQLKLLYHIGIKDVVIWLDNDNSQVIKLSLSMRTKCKSIFNAFRITPDISTTDPKNLSIDKRQRVLHHLFSEV
jgi:hypothetical protein